MLPCFGLFFVTLQALFFDRHIGELVGIEYLATFQALDKLSIFFACEHAYTGVLAGFHSLKVQMRGFLIAPVFRTPAHLSKQFCILLV